MATKRAVTKKTAAKSRDNKGQKKSKNHDAKGKFTKGNKVNEVWTRDIVIAKMEAVWKTLTHDINGDVPEDRNIVRANDIKYLYEVLLMEDITKQRWNEWKEKFKEDATVTDLFRKINMLLECRLSYSGTSMDVLHLRQHYDYVEKIKQDITTNGESLNNPFYEFLKLTSPSNQLPK